MPILPLLLFLAAAGEPDYARVCGEARATLGELVSIDTTNPPGNEVRAAQAAAKRLRTAGLSPQVLESSRGRGNVIVRLRGDGSRRPLLLLAHLDVVGAGPRTMWSTDPFKLTDKDNYLYGRGVADDKGMASIILQIAVDLHRRKVPLARDVIVALTADEESGGDAGIVWLLAHHKELLDAELALNEGAGARLHDGKIEEIAFQTDEKIYQTFFLETEGPGGHASVPMAGNAIYRLSDALPRLARFEFPARLTDTTRAYFAGLAVREPGDIGHAMDALVHARGKLPADAVKRLSEQPILSSVLRTTCVATMIEGGHRENALPQTARATVNCRILPGESPPVADTLARVVADPAVRVRADRAIGAAPPTPLEGPAFEAARKVAGMMSPGVPVLPSMSTGATDSRHLRAAGIPSYGLKPFPADDDDARRAHGRDERVLGSSFQYGCEFLYRTIEELTRK